MQIEICRARPKRNHGEGLVCPREVSPNDGKIHLREDKTDAEHGNGDHETLRRLFLRDIQPVGEGQPRGAERGVARGDGTRDDAEHGKDRTDAHAAESDRAHESDADVIDNAAGSRLFECGTKSRCTIVEGDACGRPTKRDDTLGDHRAVEYGTPHLFILQAARHDRRLCGMESGDCAARNGNEEQRPDGQIFRMEVLERHLGHGMSADAKEHSAHDAERHDNQTDAEERIKTRDDLIDRQKRRERVVDENNREP